jgi:hypothetical protein
MQKSKYLYAQTFEITKMYLIHFIISTYDKINIVRKIILKTNLMLKKSI